MDEAEARRGVQGGTPRTIEGPLYVSGAPEQKGFARMDKDPQPGDTLFMQGQVFDEQLASAGMPFDHGPMKSICAAIRMSMSFCWAKARISL